MILGFPCLIGGDECEDLNDLDDSIIRVRVGVRVGVGVGVGVGVRLDVDDMDDLDP